MPESDADETAPHRAWVTRGIDPRGAGGAYERDAGLGALVIAAGRDRAARRQTRKVSNLLQQWESDRFVAPSYVDQRTLLELDRQLFAAAQGFDAIELSPLAPLGVCSVVALTTQNRVLSALRGTEVVSDPSNVLALESARRLRTGPGSDRQAGDQPSLRTGAGIAEASRLRSAFPHVLHDHRGS